MIKKNENGQSLNQKINQHRVGHLDDSASYDVKEVEPITLIDHRRFDVIAKYIYGWFKENKIKSDYGSRLYEDHIWVFNRYDEDDGSGKKGIQSFYHSFETTLKSIKKDGFNNNISLIPVGKHMVPLDGAHRLASALLYNEKVRIVKINDEEVNYNHEFFNRKGLLYKWSDTIAYEYCKLKKNTFILVLLSETTDGIGFAKKILEKHGGIYYTKKIQLEKHGKDNLLNLLETTQDNILNQQKIINYIYKYNRFEVVLFELKEVKNRINIMDKLNSLNGKKTMAIMTNTHEKTLELAQLFFNDNSIHFLNYSKPKRSEEFKEIIKSYKKFLKENNIEADKTCIISNGVYESFGFSINKITSLSYIHQDVYSSLPDHSNFVSKNKVLLKLNKNIDDIIFNPDNYYYSCGLKFASLQTMKEIERSFGINKNQDAIRLINKILGKWRFNKEKEILVYSLKKKLSIVRLKVIQIKLNILEQIKIKL